MTARNSPEPVDWPLDLPGYVFVLRALQRLVDTGQSPEAARLKLAMAQTAAPRTNWAALQTMTGKVWGYASPEIWSIAAHRQQIFATGKYKTAHAPAPSRRPRERRDRSADSDDMQPPSWVHVHENCVSEVISAEAATTGPVRADVALGTVEAWVRKKAAELLPDHPKLETLSAAAFAEWATSHPSDKSLTVRDCTEICRLVRKAAGRGERQNLLARKRRRTGKGLSAI
jgi:hypothetical protein